ncbi:vWA domain-containing protein [Eisenibacter elegans]|jgi:uncharacterized protein YegL|uniref:vWA domain-containing protein n=1 Tax=Eisenibacter elegans TaxID=997 RepID=UPI0012B60E23|nr:vWA domain-containing protein [Eisenibacter elegans]
MSQFDSMDFNLSFNNFDPADIQVDETINAVFAIDVSPSIQAYVKDLNHAFNDFTETMQKSHVADQLMVSMVEFSEKVQVKSGFQPIKQIPKMQFKPQGHGTALHDAVKLGLEMALDYRQNLEASGVMAKTLVFVITDGMDNSSRFSAAQVKQALGDILAKESNAFSFTTILFGVGNAAQFEQAQQAMGLQHLAKVGTSGAEIRKMINFISQSISNTAANNQISF